MIGIEYSGKPTKSGGYGIDEFLEYEAGGNLYTKVKEGLDTDFTRNRHNVALDLVRMKDENSALKAQFTLGYEKKDWPVSQSALKTVTNLTTQESTTSEVTDHKDDWSEYLSPALDIYWNRRFSDRHELSVNIVATAYDTKSRKGFYEYAGATPILSSTSLTDGRKYSGIIEAVYGWTLSEKHKLVSEPEPQPALPSKTVVTEKSPSVRTSTPISVDCGVNIQETQEGSAILSERLWNISATKPRHPEGMTTSISARSSS